MNQEYVVDRDIMDNWIFVSYLVADFCFWAQHWMYVSQYVKVSALVPLIFSLQTDKVAMKRRFYQVFLTFIDIVIYSLLGIRNLVYLLDKDINTRVIDISSLITMLCITIALCISLRKIRRFTN